MCVGPLLGVEYRLYTRACPRSRWWSDAYESNSGAGTVRSSHTYGTDTMKPVQAIQKTPQTIRCFVVSYGIVINRPADKQQRATTVRTMSHEHSLPSWCSMELCSSPDSV